MYRPSLYEVSHKNEIPYVNQVDEVLPSEIDLFLCRGKNGNGQTLVDSEDSIR
jgi:hypothetical protein